MRGGEGPHSAGHSERASQRAPEREHVLFRAASFGQPSPRPSILQHLSNDSLSGSVFFLFQLPFSSSSSSSFSSSSRELSGRLFRAAPGSLWGVWASPFGQPFPRPLKMQHLSTNSLSGSPQPPGSLFRAASPQTSKNAAPLD